MAGPIDDDVGGDPGRFRRPSLKIYDDNRSLPRLREFGNDQPFKLRPRDPDADGSVDEECQLGEQVIQDCRFFVSVQCELDEFSAEPLGERSGWTAAKIAVIAVDFQSINDQVDKL